MPEVVDCRDPRSRAPAVQRAASAVRSGRLVVFPLEGGYALGTDAFSEAGVAQLRRAKQMPTTTTMGVLVSRQATLDGIARGITAAARMLVEAFWPGPLTLLVDPQPSLAWGLGSAAFAVRMPLHPLALQLGRSVGPMVFSGLASTVAPEQPLNPDVAQHPWTVLDAGELPPAPPSTIVDVRSGRARLVRTGALSEELVRAVVPTLHVTP